MSNEFYNYLKRLNEYERKNILCNSLAVSLIDFKSGWEKYSKEFDFPYRNLEVDHNNNVFQIKLHNNNNIAFIGDITIYKEEVIMKSITMIASGDGSPQSGANMFIVMGIIVACLNPNEDVVFRKTIFSQLGIFDLKVGSNNAIVVNNFKYSINISKELGLCFSVSRYN